MSEDTFIEASAQEEPQGSPPAKSLWKHREFLKLWSGQTISLLGSQVTRLALPLAAVLTLHANALQMGFLQAANTVPVLIFGLLIGVWIDRLPRRPLLIVADLGRALLLGCIPLAAFFHVLRIEQLYVIALLVAILTTFFEVAYAALLPALVSREQLVEGNSKLEVSQAGALIAGPSFAGFLVQVLSAPIAIVVDACSFVGSAIFLLLIRVSEPTKSSKEHRDAPRARFGTEMWEGLQFVWKNNILRTLGLSLAVYNLFTSVCQTVYILYIINLLGLSPSLLGIIYTIGSLGFPVGALLAQPLMKRFGVGPTIVWAACISDAAVLLVPIASKPLYFALPLLIAAQAIATFAGPVTAINQLSLRQAITPAQLQGRVNGMMYFIARSAAPLGAIAAGFLSQLIGLHTVLFIGALGVQIGFLILLFSPVRKLR